MIEKTGFEKLNKLSKIIESLRIEIWCILEEEKRVEESSESAFTGSMSKKARLASLKERSAKATNNLERIEKAHLTEQLIVWKRAAEERRLKELFEQERLRRLSDIFKCVKGGMPIYEATYNVRRRGTSTTWSYVTDSETGPCMSTPSPHTEIGRAHV